MTISLRDRYRGALVGVLAGDALLAPYETKHATDIVLDLATRGGLVPHFYLEPFNKKRIVEKGQPTDDSELTAALGLALLEPTFNPTLTYRYLRGFIHGNDGEPRKSILTARPAYGSGGTLRSALRAPTYTESFVAFREGTVRVVPTNGSLMRNTVVALRYHPDILGALEVAKRQSCITHVHPSAQVACVTHTALMNYLLMESSVKEAWKLSCKQIETLAESEKMSKDKVLITAYREVLTMSTRRPLESEVWPHTGDALLSLRCAVWALLNANDFRDGLTKVALIGGDTDTYGAIAGGLLGAHFGIDGILAEWVAALQGRDIMLKLADDLYDVSQGKKLPSE